MLPYIQVGPFHLWTYGLMLAWGLWTAYYFFREEVKRRKLPVNSGVLMIGIAIAGIVGAKLYHVIVTTVLAEHQPVSWHSLRDPVGLAWGGGLIAGFAMLAWYARHKQVSIWSLLDAASPAAAVGYAFGRMGCFLAGDGDYGKPTSLPWGMSFPHGLVPTTQRVHPTPLYELAGSLFVLFVLQQLSKRDLAPGTVFAVYLILSGAFRFAVEFIRLNPPMLLGLTEAQVIAAISVLAGFAILASSRMRTLAPAN